MNDSGPRGGGRVVRVTTDAALADAFDVRERVFVDEQGVDPDLEYDEYDEDATHTVHFVAYDGDSPVGAARLRPYGEDVAKVERVAVLRERRREGWGGRLMAAAESAAREADFDRIRLHAQTRVADFYEALGYQRTGETFEEAGIPHVAMVKSLDPDPETTD